MKNEKVDSTIVKINEYIDRLSCSSYVIEF